MVCLGRRGCVLGALIIEDYLYLVLWFELLTAGGRVTSKSFDFVSQSFDLLVLLPDSQVVLDLSVGQFDLSLVQLFFSG